MIRYDYKCVDCGCVVEYLQSIKDIAYTTCPSCLNESLERIISLGPAFVSREVTTVGQLADRNTASMGTYEKQAKRKAHKDSESQARRKIMEEKGLESMVTDGDRPTPFYGNADHTKINSMTPEQKHKYIMEGK